MKPTDQKRFIYINFMMSQINKHTDEIYEALADNNDEEVTSAIANLMAVCQELQEDVAIQTETE